MMELIEILKKEPNPFIVNAVSGPYDSQDLPDVEKYSKEPMFQIRQAITAYYKGQLSSPFLLIYGRTGTGKSYLLRKFATENHQERCYFSVQIYPTDLLSMSSTEKTSEILWKSCYKTLISENIPGFSLSKKTIRPIDFYTYKIGKKIIHEAKASGKRLFWKKTLGIFSRILSEKSLSIFNPSDEDIHYIPVFNELTWSEKEKLYRALSNNISQSIEPDCVHIADWVLAEVLREKNKDSSENYSNKLPQFTELTKYFNMPLVFILDQFEDLAISGKYLDNLNSVMLRLQAFHRQVIEQRWPISPIFLLALPEDPQLSMPAQIIDRCSILPNGKKFIDLQSLSGVQDWEVAQNFVQCYLKNFQVNIQKKSSNHKQILQPLENNPPYPFKNGDLQLLHQVMMQTSGNYTIREWLNLCQMTWNYLIFTTFPESLEERRQEWQEQLKKKLGKTTLPTIEATLPAEKMTSTQPIAETTPTQPIAETTLTSFFPPTIAETTSTSFLPSATTTISQINIIQPITPTPRIEEISSSITSLPPQTATLVQPSNITESIQPMLMNNDNKDMNDPWPPLNQTFKESVKRHYLNFEISLSSDEQCLPILQDFFKSLEKLNIIDNTINSEIITDDSEIKLYLRFSSYLIAFSWKSAQGRGCKNEFDSLKKLAKNSSIPKCLLLKVYKNTNGFPYIFATKLRQKNKEDIYYMTEDDWSVIYAILALGQSRYKPQSDISKLQMPKWFDAKEDYTDIIRKLVEENKFLKKFSIYENSNLSRP